MNSKRRVLAAFTASVMSLAVLVAGAASASADDRQTGSGPLSITVTDSTAIVPPALRTGSAGTVSVAYRAPGAWAFIQGDPARNYTPGQNGQGMAVDMYRVVALDGSSLDVATRQSVCAGASVSVSDPAAPRLPSVDLSTVPWIAQGLASRTLIFSGDYTGKPGWNPNLSGMIWSPAVHGEMLSLVDTRLGSPAEWNLVLTYTVSTYFTPGWDCSSVLPPFDPNTGDLSPVAVPDKGTVPVGARSVRISVLNNDTLPNGVTALQIVAAPSNGTATVDVTSADWPVEYVPNQGFVGQDTFSYQVTDNLAKVSSTTVVVDVLGEVVVPPVVADPAPPVAAPVVTDPTPFAAATGVDVADVSSLSAVRGLLAVVAVLVLVALAVLSVRRRRLA